jgi:hypothetical protein
MSDDSPHPTNVSCLFQSLPSTMDTKEAIRLNTQHTCLLPQYLPPNYPQRNQHKDAQFNEIQNVSYAVYAKKITTDLQKTG